MSHFSEMAQALRAAQGGRRALRRRCCPSWWRRGVRVGGHVRGATLGAVVGARRARATRGEEEEDLRSVHQLGQERCRARRRFGARRLGGFPRGAGSDGASLELLLAHLRIVVIVVVRVEVIDGSSGERGRASAGIGAVDAAGLGRDSAPGVYVADPGPRAGDGHAPARRTGVGADPPREDGDRNRHDAVGAR